MCVLGVGGNREGFFKHWRIQEKKGVGDRNVLDLRAEREADCLRGPGGGDDVQV